MNVILDVQNNVNTRQKVYGQLMVQSFKLIVAPGTTGTLNNTVIAGRGNVMAYTFTVATVTAGEESLADFTFSANNNSTVVNANGATFANTNQNKPLFSSTIPEQAAIQVVATNDAAATTDAIIIVELYFSPPQA